MKTVFDIINEISSSLSVEALDLIYGKVKQIPLKTYDEQLVNFVKEFSINSLQAVFVSERRARKEKENQKQKESDEDEKIQFTSDDDKTEELEFEQLKNLDNIIEDSDKGESQCTYGLYILWELVQDNSGAS